MRRRRLLLAAHPTVGHTNALRAIGRRLRAQGHEVAMATTLLRVPQASFVPEPARVASTLPAAIRADGLELVSLPPSLRMLWHATRIPGATGYDELGHAVGIFTADLEGHARTLAREARRLGAEVIVADYLCFAAYLAAQLTRLPFVAFYHSALPFAQRGAPPFGSGLAHDAPRDARWAEAERRLEALSSWLDARLSRASRALGLPEPSRRLLARPYSKVLNLLATLPALEPGLGELSGPVVFTGPCLDARPDERADDPALTALREGARRVYVSLGTVFNDKPELFVTLLRALERDDVQVIVSAGASFARLSREAPTRNAHVFRRVPQLALLERVDAVITHGGNNTTQETLVAGKPMLVLPFGGDQLENARRVERLGVGVSLSPRGLDLGRARAATSRLLDDPSLAESARALAGKLERVDGVARAVDAIVATLARDDDR